MSEEFTDVQLDALREVANTGAGYAAADLSEMIGSSVSIDVPRAIATTLPEALDQLGASEESVNAVLVAVEGAQEGSMDAVLVAMFSPEQACGMGDLLGVDTSTEMGQSMLGEIGNVLACAYAGVIAEMAQMSFEIHPPTVLNDMLGALVSSLSARIHPESDTVLLIDSHLSVRESNTGLTVLFVPASAGIGVLLDRLGVG
ncbi:MAG: chemotaxis protein CheC [Thermoleophilia bacterium]|nr:chemotaxis protein CheC [Thermoleophilia bacterium]